MVTHCTRCRTPCTEFYHQKSGDRHKLIVCGSITHRGHEGVPCKHAIACGRPWCKLESVPVCTFCKLVVCEVDTYGEDGPVCDLCDTIVCQYCVSSCEACSDYLCPAHTKRHDDMDVCEPCVAFLDYQESSGLNDRVKRTHELLHGAVPSHSCINCTYDGPERDEAERLYRERRDEIRRVNKKQKK